MSKLPAEQTTPFHLEEATIDELHRAIKRVREALPDASILLMSPMDRGELNGTGDIVTTPALMRLVKREAQVADEAGVAFFNTFEAMGGEGTMARWYASEPRIVGADYIHPLPAGGKIVGGLLYHGLQTGFQAYKLRRLSEKFNQTVAGQAAPVLESSSAAQVVQDRPVVQSKDKVQKRLPPAVEKPVANTVKSGKKKARKKRKETVTQE